MSQHGERIIFVSANGRPFSQNIVDEIIVGRIFGNCRLEDIVLYITHNNMAMAGITVDELDDFWNFIVLNHANPHLGNWADLQLEDPRVQVVLGRLTRQIL